MRWAKYTAGGRTSWGLIEGDSVFIEVSGDPFGEWRKGTSTHKLASVTIEVPLIPRTFYCAGLNYATHVKEVADKRGDVPNIPDRRTSAIAPTTR